MDENQQMGHRKWHGKSGHGAAGGTYGLGFIGAVIYFIQNADTFGAGIVGILKAIVWPAFLVYKLFQYFGI